MELLRAPSRRWLRTMQLAAGLGWLAGAFEMVEITSTLSLSLSFAQALLLSVGCSLAGAVVAVCVALPVGLALQRLGRSWSDSVFLATAMAATAFLLSGFYLWHAAGNLVDMERVPSAIAMAVCPFGVAGVVWFNAGYWARREELGGESKLGWTGFALIAGLAIGAAASGVSSSTSYGSSMALAGDPNVLLITLDTTRRDHISAYGDSPAQTPNIDRLAEQGVLFQDAVTPLPETGPSHASMFTSLHPLRHRVLSNADTLARGHVTIAERLEAEGYATGAFLSSFAVGEQSGLDQGFQVYDDDFVPGLRGWSRILLFQYAVRGLMASGRPHLVPWMLERSGQGTVELASDWIQDRGERPWFAWVHLFEPHAPYESADAKVNHRELLSDPQHVFTQAEVDELRRIYALEVEQVDALVGQLMLLLEESGADTRTLVIVVGDHGEMLGEHGIFFHHHGLYDPAIAVPLIIRAPRVKVHRAKIPMQVRVMDIGPTILRYIKLDPFLPAEGSELLGYAQGVRKTSMVCDLVGRQGPQLGQGCLVGIRTASKKAAPEGEGIAPPKDEELRVKVLFHADSSKVEFYNLLDDPQELSDISEQQQNAVESARARAQASLDGFDCVATELPAWQESALKSMGYIEE